MHNKDITKTKAETKVFYQIIIQEGSKQHTIAGSTGDNLHLFTKCSRIQNNLDTKPTNTCKTNRKNVYSTTTLTHAKRQKYK